MNKSETTLKCKKWCQTCKAFDWSLCNGKYKIKSEIDTLKEEVNKTIESYTDALKKENLNYDYLNKNNLKFGICDYAYAKKYTTLYNIIRKRFEQYLTTCACQCLHSKKLLAKVHQDRIDYLNKILKELD